MKNNKTQLEDLRKWFGKGKKGDWVRVGTDGEIKGQCAREPDEGKPKCMPRDKAHSMSKKDRASAARRKRRADPNPDRPGTGNKPIMVSTDKKKKNEMNEKNVPTNPKLWAKFKAQAKAKFDVYPSAYANGWAAKQYKAAGGGWKTESVQEMKTFSQMREPLQEKSVSQAQQKMMGMALAYKRGEMDDASPEVKKMANSMSMKDLEDFAKTKHKGLPKKVEESNWKPSASNVVPKKSPKYSDGDRIIVRSGANKNYVGKKGTVVSKSKYNKSNYVVKLDGGSSTIEIDGRVLVPESTKITLDEVRRRGGRREPKLSPDVVMKKMKEVASKHKNASIVRDSLVVRKDGNIVLTFELSGDTHGLSAKGPFEHAFSNLQSIGSGEKGYFGEPLTQAAIRNLDRIALELQNMKEEVELEEMNLSKQTSKQLLQFYRKYADRKMSPSDANTVRAVRRELIKRGVSIKEEVELEEWKKDSGWKKAQKIYKDRYGNIIKKQNLAKHLAKKAQQKTSEMDK